MPLNSIASQLDSVTTAPQKSSAKARKNRRRFLALLISLATVSSSELANAAGKYWNTDGISNTWTAANWGLVPAGPFTEGWDPNDDAIFGANSLITYVTNTQIGNVTVNPGFTVALTPAGTLSTNGNVRTLDVGANSVLDFSNQAFSSAAGTGFVKNGTGLYVSSTTAGFSGGFTLNNGIVVVGSVNGLGAGGALNINGGTIGVSSGQTFTNKFPGGINIGGDFTLGALTTGGVSQNGIAGGSINFATDAVSLGNTTRTITLGTAGAVTFGGVISGTSATTGLTIATSGTATSGTITLSGANTYTGVTRVSGGGSVLTTVNVSGNQSAANGGWNIGNGNNTASQTVNFQTGSTIAVASGNTIQLGNTNASGTTATLNVAGTVTNSGNLNIQRSAVLNINNGANWTQSGAMLISAPGASGTSTAMNVAAGGAFNYTGTTPITLNPAMDATGNATLTVSGSGVFTTGQGFVNSLASTSGTGLASIVLTGGGTLKLSANVPELLTTSTNLSLLLGSGSSGTIDTNGFSTTISRPLGSTSGTTSLVKNGAGTLTLTTSNPFPGSTTINGGTVKIGTGTTPLGTGASTFAVGGTLDLNGFNTSTGITNPRGTLTNSSATAGGIGGTVASVSSNFTVDGIGDITLPNITGSAGSGITKNGTNTLFLGGSGENTAMSLTVNSGTVSLSKTSSTARAVNGPLVINGGTVTLGTTGGDQIQNNAAVTVTVNGGTFDINSRNETLTGTLQIGNGTTNGSITGTTGTLTNQATISAQSGSATANLAGTGGLNKTTAGTVTLSGANSYLGATTVAEGTLVVSNNKALGYGGTSGLGITSAGTSVAAGAVLDVSGQSSIQETITLNGTGSGAGALINTSGTPAVIGGGVATLTLLTGGGGYGTSNPAVTVTGGDGTGATAAVTRGLTESSFSISGGTTVYSVAPTVAISSGNGTGATATAILTDGVVTGIMITNPGTGFSSVPNITFSSGTITTPGTNPTGTGNSANFQISGITLSNGGTGFTSAPTVTISGSTPATATAALTQVILGSTSSVGGTGDITINSVVSESAAGFGLTKVGSNTLTLGAANNTYTGPTTVSAGTLKLVSTNTNSIASSSQIALGGGTLDVTSVPGFVLANNQVLSGAGTVSGSLMAGSTTEVRPGGTGVAGTLNFGPLTLSGAGLTFDVGTTSDLIDLGTNLLTGTGTNTFTLNSVAGFGVGNYTLIDYGTLDGGTGLSNFALSSPTLAGFNVALSDTGSAIVLTVTSTGPGGPSIWQGANNDLWTAAGSWNGSVPNSNTAEAQFVTTGGTTAILDANQTVNKLTFDATAPHTISGASTLTLAGMMPTISTAGSNTATQTVAVNLDLAAGTAINVQGGTLELNSPANAVLGAGVTATVANGATLSLGGTGNALSNGTSTHADVANSGTLLATTTGKRVGNIDGTGTTTVTAANATLTANHVRQSTVNIGAGNTVTIASNGGNSGTSVVTNLSINATGKLDLDNNDLIVPNGNLTTLTAQLATGLDINGNYGGGPGITSSAFANNMDFNTVLGIAANSDLGYTSFSGQTVGNNDVLIKYTYYGDADLSGSVDTSTDFDLYITGLTSGGSLGGWLFGDFDYSGTVDSSTDFDLYITGLTSQGSPLLTAGGGGGNLVQAVPEPSTLVLGGLALLGFAGVGLRRRRLALQQA